MLPWTVYRSGVGHAISWAHLRPEGGPDRGRGGGRMRLAALMLIAVPVVLVLLGLVVLIPAVRALQCRSGSRGAAVLRLVAGAGLLLWALVSASWLVVEMQYSVVVLPMLGLSGAEVGTILLLGSPWCPSTASGADRDAPAVGSDDDVERHR